MTVGSRDLVAWGDVPAALGLLSRVPVRVDFDRATARGAKAAWAWPVAGVVIGALVVGVAVVALALGLSPALAAGLVLVVQAVLTGAMHEDGLADCADGFWGGWTPERRLEIMKDSRIGAYGVIALVLSLVLRWQGLALVLEAGLWPVLIGLAAMSRAPMVVLMAALPGARAGGLGQSVGRPGVATAVLACAVALVAGGAGLGWLVLPVAVVMVAMGLGWAMVCRAKIGGQTGDTAGALQQLAEIGGLLTVCAVLGLG
jgi:adenosylcobinamide-GDP ribazoletransferase